MRLFFRALFAFIALPGMIAFVVPLVWMAPGGREVSVDSVGIAPLAIGIIVLLWCVRDFYVAGKGTLAPRSPPQQLVRVGLYRYSRNPMYVGVSLILWGWALGFRSKGLAIYAFAVMIAFHFRVVLAEEPWLEATFGEKWRDYKTRVPRWIPTRRAP